MPSFLLSDFVFPIGNMPKVLQFVSRIIPATYFIDILNGLYLRNLGLARLWPSYAVLTGMCLFLLLVNFRKLRKEGM
jgi:ABC-2 type transport system permease protein